MSQGSRGGGERGGGATRSSEAATPVTVSVQATPVYATAVAPGIGDNGGNSGGGGDAENRVGANGGSSGGINGGGGADDMLAQQFTNFGAGQLGTQESQLVNNMMMMNPYMMLNSQLLSSAMNPKIQLPSLRKGEEPHLVNAKQYHRILKRRAQRAALAKQSFAPKKRKAFLHESRHKHAMRRPRGPGGRFLRKEEIEALKVYQQQLEADLEAVKASGGDVAMAEALLTQTVASVKKGKIGDKLLKNANLAHDAAVAQAQAQHEAALRQQKQAEAELAQHTATERQQAAQAALLQMRPATDVAQ